MEKIKILKIANDIAFKNSERFIGVYVNNEVNTQLTLLSITDGVSKSTLLRKIVIDLLAPKDLIVGVADRLYHSFKMKGEPWSDFPTAKFIRYAKKELRKKGLDKATLDLIFKEFNNLVKAK